MPPRPWKWLSAALALALAARAGASPGAPPGQEPGADGERDVIERIYVLRMPLDVAGWWKGALAHPERWGHPLSEWERKYVEAMSAASVPEPVRMKAPVTPERLTPSQTREAEQFFGVGPASAQAYANWENRRRTVTHYMMTHPATVRFSVGLYGLSRDVNPISFAFERGWQVGSGEEMLTGQDVSRLGAAGEFFTALAAGVATGKLLRATRPSPPEGSRPPSAPLRPDRESAVRTPGAPGEVIPLDRARPSPRPPEPATHPIPGRAEQPFAATGTDGAPVPKGPSASGGAPSVARGETPKVSSRSTGPEAAGFESLVDVAAGDSLAVVEAKFTLLESSASGTRLPRNVEAVQRAKPSLESPRSGVAHGSVRWREYVTYYEKRLAEMRAAERAGQLDSARPPLDWPAYETVRDTFSRGIAFQRARVEVLRSAAKLRGFSKPHVQSNAGVLKDDLRFADALVTETDPSSPFRVEVYSYKSRNFRTMNQSESVGQIRSDVRDATKYYGGEVDIRTPALGMRGKPVKVDKVHLVYDRDFRPFDKDAREALQELMKTVGEAGVEVRFE